MTDFTYKLAQPSLINNEVMSVWRSDGWQIPFDPANTDYQAFLRWCDEGGVPEPADVPTAPQGETE